MGLHSDVCRWTLAAVALVAGSVLAAPVDIPYSEFTLDNGLRVIVHQDTKAPIVAVNLWYHVGSKNERPGRTGFAHLFEHLMFNGSENYNDEYFKPFQQIGATGMNGTTSTDRTNYFQTVPKTALDLALWMESDRMGHLLGAIDQARLDEQRAVVRNEKRQGESQPYGRAWNVILANLFPQGHPYSWSTIGSMEDLDAANLDDVQEWFKTYYGPNNAVLVLAGDIDEDTAREKAEHYFGDIQPGPPLQRLQQWIPQWTAERRVMMQDRVPQTRIYKIWAGPRWGTQDATLLGLVSTALAGNKNSRLYKRLVYDTQLATNVSALPISWEIAGGFGIVATVQPGGDAVAVEALLEEELQRFLARGPTREELQRVKAQTEASFVRGIERVGGFGGKSDILAEGAVFGNDPGYYKRELDWVASASGRDIRDAARRWLSSGPFVLEVMPFADDLTAATQGADRSKLPEPASFPTARFGAFDRATLANGLEIIVAERHAVPVVQFSLILDAGFAADQLGTAGAASLAMTMLDEGTASRSALDISDEAARLGAYIGAGSNLDTSAVSLSALTANLDPSLELYADLVLEPAFPQAELERLRKLRLAAIQREKASPVGMALRVFPKLLYGAGHAYSLPLTGSGTEASIARLTRADLVRFHDTWFKPNNASLIVVGDTTLADIVPKLERLFADWAPGEVPTKNIAPVALPAQPRIFLVDRPDSDQSTIYAGHVVAPKANDAELALQTLNDILGGSFVSRINLNLREDKGWTYGSRTRILDAAGPRPFYVSAPVQADKTADAIREIARELNQIVGASPPGREEVETAKRRSILTLPGRWETAGAVLGSLGEIVRFGLPDDYWDQYVTGIEQLSAADVDRAARATLRPDQLTWVVVGDSSQVAAQLAKLGLGPVQLIDADGNLLAEQPAAGLSGAGSSR
jgi:zinc protease